MNWYTGTQLVHVSRCANKILQGACTTCDLTCTLTLSDVCSRKVER